MRELERTKWLLWYGNGHRSRQHAEDLRDDVKALELDYPHLGKFARSAQEFAFYIRSNASSLINYGERFRSGERISSAMAESTVNAVVSKRSPSASRCSGPGAAPICCCKPAPAPSTAPSGPCSSGGI